MKRKIGIITIIILSLFVLISCDEINGIISLLPKFDTNLPNNISGKYAYFDSPEAKEHGNFSRLFAFDSKEGTFTETESKESVTTKKGSYSVSYSTYTIMECNGKLSLSYEDGSSTSYDFYYYATATGGPEYIILSDHNTYYYWGK